MHLQRAENTGHLSLSEVTDTSPPRSEQRVAAARTLARLMSGLESIPASHDAPDNFHPTRGDLVELVTPGNEAALTIQPAAQEDATRLSG